MAKFKKNTLVIFIIISTVIILIVPFFFKSRYDLIAIYSLIFTAIAAIATVATFIVAILLYDKFGLEHKFIDKQTDKVLELIDLLKGKVITAKTKGFTYFVRTSRSKLLELNSVIQFNNDSKKAF
jgi:hypothetical protein